MALLVALDALAAAIALVLSRVLNFGLEPAEWSIRSYTVPYALLAVAIVPTWLAVLAIKGAYDVGPFGTSVRGRRVIRAAADFLAVVAVSYFVLHLEDLARGFLIATLPLAVLLTLAFRWLAGRVLRARRRHGLAVRRTVIVGSREIAGEIVRRLAVRRSVELDVLAACVPGRREPFVVDGRRVPVLGGPDDVLPVLQASGADTVVLTGDLAHGRVRELAWSLEGTGVDVFVVPALAHEAVEIDVRPVAGLPLVFVDHERRPRLAGGATPPAGEPPAVTMPQPSNGATNGRHVDDRISGPVAPANRRTAHEPRTDGHRRIRTPAPPTR